MSGVGKTMNVSSNRLKIQVTVALIALCLLPTLLNFLGIDFSSESKHLTSNLTLSDTYLVLRGAIYHALLEWSAVTIAGLVAVASLIHYIRNNDITVPIIGLALLSAGIVDAYHTLAAMRVIGVVKEAENFIPFTWALSRIFNASIFLLAVLLSLYFHRRYADLAKSNAASANRVILIIGSIFVSATAVILVWVSLDSQLPQTQFKDALIKRPYDAIPLALFVFSAAFYWTLYVNKPNAVRYALFLSLLPEITTQLHMAFGSSALFDNHFNIAHFLKVVAYSMILLGVLLDFIDAEARYSATAKRKVRDEIKKQSKAIRTFSNLGDIKYTKSLAVKIPMMAVSIALVVALVVGSVLIYEAMQLSAEFAAIYEELHTRIVIIVISLLLVVLAIAVFIGQKITQPLSNMIVSIKEFEHTGKVQGLPTNSSDEIGMLARTFDNMMTVVEKQNDRHIQDFEAAKGVSAKLQSVLNSMVDAVINIDDKGVIVAFNKSAEQMFGYTEQEILGENIKILMPAEYADQHDGYIADYRKTGKQSIISRGRELPALRKSGETFPMFLSVSEIETAQGKLFTGLIRDITASKLMEAERTRVLESAKDLAWRLDFALSGPKIGVWDYDLKTGNVNWDKRMFRLYDIEQSERDNIQELWQNRVHEQDLPTLLSAVEKSVETGVDFNQTYRIILPNQMTRYIESHARAFYDDYGNITRLVGTNRDVTEQQQLQELKQQALDMAEDSLRMKSEFLASMSHEIRTPMNGVLGMIGLLEKTPLNKRQSHYLKLAGSSASSLLNLINDILDFSKIEAGKLDFESLDFDVRKQLGEVTESLAIKAQDKGLELILDLKDVAHDAVKGDPTRVRQIISNLVSNAIKFTEQGEIVVRASTRENAEGSLMLSCSVSDSGIGIPKDKVRTLFDSFTQVDASTTRKYGGTGLGLAIVKQLCEMMSGTISVKSELGVGSTFEFDIKVEKGQSQAIALPRAEIKGRNILIVDDNETNLAVLKGQLENWGANVFQAQSGQQALNMAKQHAAHFFDIAILDMQMPEMDGAMLGKSLRALDETLETKLIMMTSMGATGDAEHFAKLGFAAYFPKPATTSDLFDALNIVLDDGKALSVALPLVTHENLQILHRNDKQPISTDTNILLVEDNRINQVVALGVLEGWSLTADVAENGRIALDMLTGDKQYDVVLMDCQMPEMDGYQATQAIRALSEPTANIPIIAMTANAMKGDKEKCIDAGMDDYLAKPLDGELLLEKLLTYLPDHLCNTATSSSNEIDTTSMVGVERVAEPHNTPEAVEEVIEQLQKPVWDKESLLNRVRNNDVIAGKLVDMFLSESVENLKVMLMVMNKKQYHEISQQAHKLKGSVKNLGGLRLAEVIVEIEMIAKEKDGVRLPEMTKQFEHEFDNFVNALASFSQTSKV